MATRTITKKAELKTSTAKTNVVPKQTDSPYNNMKLKKCTENDTKRLI